MFGNLSALRCVPRGLSVHSQSHRVHNGWSLHAHRFYCPRDSLRHTEMTACHVRSCGHRLGLSFSTSCLGVPHAAQVTADFICTGRRQPGEKALKPQLRRDFLRWLEGSLGQPLNRSSEWERCQGLGAPPRSTYDPTDSAAFATQQLDKAPLPSLPGYMA